MSFSGDELELLRELDIDPDTQPEAARQALLEERAYIAQHAFILENFGTKAADGANYGWGVDEVTGSIETKVYGHGVLVTDIDTCEHEFESW